MLVKLSNLKEIAMKLYERHQAGLLSVEEYLHLMTPIDEAIDKLEMQSCISRLVKALACQSSEVKS